MLVGPMLVACVAGIPWQARAEPPSTGVLVARAAAWVRTLDAELPGLVGVEHSTQAEEANPARQRRLTADLAWVPMLGLADTIAVREVRDVDGMPVPAGRLRVLLTGRDADPERTVRELLDASAAHNLAEGSRNLNFPTFPLVYLRGDRPGRLKWHARADDGGRTVLEFEERRQDAMVRTADGGRLPARGRLWIDTATGRVERSETRFEARHRELRPIANGRGARVARRLTYAIDVTFGRDAHLGLWLPVSMAERYESRDDTASAGDTHVVVGSSTYGPYQRFETGARLLPR